LAELIERVEAKGRREREGRRERKKKAERFRPLGSFYFVGGSRTRLETTYTLVSVPPER
jgi:hypothetical protein